MISSLKGRKKKRMDKALLEHYAYALFSLSKEENKEEAYRNERNWLDQVFKQNPAFLTFLSSPEISWDEKEKARKDVFQDQLSKATEGFLLIRRKRKARKEFHSIVSAYNHLYNEDTGVREGRVYTAFELSDLQRKELEEGFSKQYQKKVTLTQFLDPSLIGGRKVYIGDTLYDNSVDSRLEAVRKSLLNQKA